ncbi:MAG: protein translocase subunit SecF [Porticoccus sp.]|nr:protein translocase subunit SecF [Porticoccus sp.]MBQ0806806.1 protein translocase subunit SecF [Porticoccus sp.]
MTTQRIIDFMGHRKLAAIVSALLIIASLLSLSFKGVTLGLDFTGGTQIEVGYQQPADLEAIRSQLTTAGFESPVVVHFGSESDVLIRLQGKPEAGLSDEVLKALGNGDNGLELRRVDYVGPQVGDELREDGGLGMLAALAIVMLYVAIRFQYKFSLGAVAALAHDVIITLGFFSLTGMEFDLTVLAAVLAVIGYSLNDTIVVSDRIRENFRLLRKSDALSVINESLTQTLGRTLITSLTTLLVLFALFLFGGELIHNFAVALIVGVFVGTYSSIYVAANILLTLGMTREDLLPPEKEGEEFDGLP